MAIRIIESKRKRESTNESFIKLKIIKVPDLFEYRVSLFMYNLRAGKLPCVFDHYFIKNSDFHVLNTRAKEEYRIPKVKCNVGERFVKKAGVIIWNNLSKQIDTCVSIGMFKSSLSSLIISRYTNE